MFCSFVPRLITGKDICGLSDDGNPGAFNVFRHCGAGVGCLCLALDVLKGLVLLAALYIAFSLIRLSSNRVRSIIVYSLFAVLSAVVLCLCGLFAAALGCGMISLTAVLKHLLPLQGSINKRGAEFKGND